LRADPFSTLASWAALLLEAEYRVHAANSTDSASACRSTFCTAARGFTERRMRVKVMRVPRHVVQQGNPARRDSQHAAAEKGVIQRENNDCTD